MKPYKHRFDFEIGYLVKSPCKNCKMRHRFPDCIDECEVLDKIQTLMSGAVSSTRAFSDLESFAISSEDMRRK
jgi:hypothetical protein